MANQYVTTICMHSIALINSCLIGALKKSKKAANTEKKTTTSLLTHLALIHFLLAAYMHFLHVHRLLFCFCICHRFFKKRYRVTSILYFFLVHSKSPWQDSGIVLVRNCFANTKHNCLLLLHFTDIWIIQSFWFYVRRRWTIKKEQNGRSMKKCNSLTFRSI